MSVYQPYPKLLTNITAPMNSVTNTRIVANKRYRKTIDENQNNAATYFLDYNKLNFFNTAKLIGTQFWHPLKCCSYLPSSYSWYNEDEGEGNHTKGDQEANLKEILRYWSLVLTIEGREGLVTERIPHCFSLSLLFLRKFLGIAR